MDLWLCESSQVYHHSRQNNRLRNWKTRCAILGTDPEESWKKKIKTNRNKFCSSFICCILIINCTNSQNFPRNDKDLIYSILCVSVNWMLYGPELMPDTQEALPIMRNMTTTLLKTLVPSCKFHNEFLFNLSPHASDLCYQTIHQK